MLSRKLFILFFIALYLLIPIADSIACDDCSLSSVLHKRVHPGCADHEQERTVSAISIKHSGDPSSSNAGDVHCPLCFNSAYRSGVYCGKTFLQSGSLQHVAGLASYHGPSFPIVKPPQN
jgi:hypothetical protein